MTIEISRKRLTLNNVDPFQILILLGDKVDKSTIKNIATPNFSIVVKPSDRPDFVKREGDYTVVVRKDNGEEAPLCMPHRGAKMLYVLTLLCQKAVGGLPNKYFTNERAAAAIEALYDKFYRSGGNEWVEGCAANNHNLSIFRTHAKNAVENNEALDNVVRYWCGFEDEKRMVGKNQLQLRRIRIPNDRIVFEDAVGSRVSFEQLIEQLPPLHDLFGFSNKTTERICEVRIKKASGILRGNGPFNYRIA
ncbi:MAG: hypothetical protein IKH33_05550 [Bacteroidales bacterium]|nr:hypothetical protein [Bacteroidales bacterium]